MWGPIDSENVPPFIDSRNVSNWLYDVRHEDDNVHELLRAAAGSRAAVAVNFTVVIKLHFRSCYSQLFLIFGSLNFEIITKSHI